MAEVIAFPRRAAAPRGRVLSRHGRDVLASALVLAGLLAALAIGLWWPA